MAPSLTMLLRLRFHIRNFLFTSSDVIFAYNDVICGILSIACQVFILSTIVVEANDDVKLFVHDSYVTNQV